MSTSSAKVLHLESLVGTAWQVLYKEVNLRDYFSWFFRFFGFLQRKNHSQF